MCAHIRATATTETACTGNTPAVATIQTGHTLTDVIAYTGNSNEETCGWSPAGAPGVIAVGAVDSQMRRWYSSNW